MYIPGNIIYFDPFYFKSGDAAKPKYFLVLYNKDEKTVLVSLPSSKFHLPANISIPHGCINISSLCISCYVFKSGVEICQNGWYFQLDTYLYGNWIDEYDVSLLHETYAIEGIEYEIKGKLLDEELKKVLDCFKNSNTVKRKFIRMLNS